MKKLALSFGITILLVGGSLAQTGPWPLSRQDRWGTARAPSSPANSALVPAYIQKSLGNYIVSHGPSLGPNGVGFYGTWVSNTLYKFNYGLATNYGPTFNASNFITSTPAISDAGIVVFSTDNPSSGHTFAVNASTMTVAWSLQTDVTGDSDYVHSSPTIGPDKDIVVNDAGGDVWRLKTSGATVWHATSYGSHNSVVFSRDDSKIFIATSGSITALNYADGTEAWTKTFPSQPGPPATAPDGTLVFGTQGGTVYLVDAANGDTLFTVATGAAITSPAAFDSEGIAYVTSQDDSLYAVNVSTGKVAWSFQSDNICDEGPSLDANNNIYFQNRGGSLYSLTPEGTQRWKLSLPGEARGGLTIGPDDTVYAPYVGTPSGIAIVRQTLPAVQSVGLRTTSIVGGSSDVAEVYLQYPTPSGGESVMLQSSNTSVASIQSSVAVAGGSANSPYVTITTSPVTAPTTVTITATTGSVHASANLLVEPPAISSVALPSSITAGNSGNGTITAGTKSTSSVTYTLTSGDPAALAVPATVIIPAGELSASFPFDTYGVNASISVTVTAKEGSNSKTGATVVEPAALTTFLLLEPRIEGGVSTTGFFFLSGEAGSACTVTLESSDLHVTVPPTAMIPDHYDGISFPITTKQVTVNTSVTLTAKLGSATVTATILLTPMAPPKSVP